MRTTKTVSNVAMRMMTKNADLKSQCTPTNWPQFVQLTSDRISPVTEIDSLEQCGHFLFNEFCLFSPESGLGSVMAPQKSITGTSANEGRPDVRQRIIGVQNLIVCFSQKRPVRSQENHENEGQETARRGRSAQFASVPFTALMLFGCRQTITLDTGLLFNTFFSHTHWAARCRRLKPFLCQFLSPLNGCPVAGPICFVFELFQRRPWRTTDGDYRSK